MKKASSFFSAAMLCLLASTSATAADPYGLDERPQIGPYLNGNLPPVPPQPAQSFTTIDAFPNLRFQNPTYLTFGPGTGRLFVCEREGRVLSFANNPNATNSTVVVDIRAHCQGWGDCGLISMVFHPEFGKPGSPNRGYFYVWYNWAETPTLGPDVPPDYTHTRNRLSRFTIPDGSLVADPASETILIDQLDEHPWHNGGGMFFHPQDGFLYLTLGDEGGASDNWGNAQKIDKDLFSGVIRIDVDKRADRSHPPTRQPATGTTANYWIPNDNPFVGVPNALEEFYAIGLRSPHRMTYDSTSGRAWIGDVGQRAREELDLLEKSANYQWAYKEGTLDVAGNTKPATIIGNERPPVYEYAHDNGNFCIIGGYVYRGNALAAELWGKYIFADNVSGRIWGMDYDGFNAPTPTELCVLPSTWLAYTGLSSFGIDENGELFLCILGNNEKADGHIRKLVRADNPSTTSIPQVLSRTGAFDNVATIAPNAGLLPYNVNSPLWSDGARKNRWIAVPNSTTIQFDAKNEWKFPAGTVALKHFELPIDETQPNLVRRLETRLLVRDPNGAVYGVTYKWRADNSDADLLASSLSEDLAVKLAAAPAALTGEDIGSPMFAGQTTPVSGGYDVSGSGSDIWGPSDQFQFAHQTRSGDFDIRVQIQEFSAQNSNAKAGLMVRESTAASSRYVFAFVFPDNSNGSGYQLEHRDATGGNSAAIFANSSFTVSYPNTWLRLKRNGANFTAYASNDGIIWRSFASYSLGLNNNVEVGLAITSHNSGAVSSAKFRNFDNVRGQTWYYPSRSDCLLCHNATSGYLLGINTRQLNGALTFPSTGRTDNQLRTWNHLGLFSADLGESNIQSFSKLVNVKDTSASINERARSYLDANCSHCHRPNGARAFFDARYEIPLFEQHLLNGNANETLGITGAKIIAPREVDKSVLFARLNSLDSIAMPPVAKGLIDQDAIIALREFINYYPTVGFDLPNTTVAESVGSAHIPVSLNTSVQLPVAVNYVVSNISATAGADFVLANGTLNFAPGSTHSEIVVPIVNDNRHEGDETFAVTLTAADNATLDGNLIQTVTIVDDDAPASGPIIGSGITATPNPAYTGDEVVFAADIWSELPLRWQWFFGDGLSANSEGSARHTFVTAGSYDVTVVASDSRSSVTSTVPLIVLNSPNPVTPPSELRISKLSGKVNFSGKDSVSLTANFDSDANNTAGATAILGIAGASAEFNLSARGRARNASGSFSAKFNKKKQTIAITAALSGDSFSDAWRNAGMGPGPADLSVQLPIILNLGGRIYQSKIDVRYRARNALLGRFLK